MSGITLSCAFATSLDTPEHIRIAEQLGYSRAWAYDSPALYPDVWGILYLAAERSETIGLGPAVLIPSLRHPMANAAGIAGLVALAPGRVAVALGSGFTGRYTLGHRPLRWAWVEEYVVALKGLLAGETVEWEGRPIRMMHPDGFGAVRPVDIPILLGADGPKGIAVARAIADGVFSAGAPSSAEMEWHALLQFGTVLDEGESADSERVFAAAGHGVAVLYHAVYERGGAAVDEFPGGAVWREAVEQIPEAERHLSTHDGHLVHLTDRDRAALQAGGSAMLPTLGLTGTAAQLRERVDELSAAGVSEIAYQPAGPDIPRELERLAAALA